MAAKASWHWNYVTVTPCIRILKAEIISKFPVSYCRLLCVSVCVCVCVCVLIQSCVLTTWRRARHRECSSRWSTIAHEVSKLVRKFLPARRYASAGTSYGPVSVAVCLLVCLSVCYKSELYRNDWTNRVNFGTGSSFVLSYPILHRVIRKFGYLQK